MAPKAMRTYRDFASATTRENIAHKLVRWLLSTGRFPEFRLAEQYRAAAVQATEELVAAYHQRQAGVPPTF
jgi:hypothetical protein